MTRNQNPNKHCVAVRPTIKPNPESKSYPMY